MKDNNKELLEILFNNYLKCFDNAFIILLLNYYKNKTPISNTDFYSLVNAILLSLSVIVISAPCSNKKSTAASFPLLQALNK